MSDICEMGRPTSVDELIAALREQDPRLPGAITVELTNRCNFGCPHCFCRLPEDARTDPPELTFSEWDRILGECTDEGTLFITFTGGEAMLHPDFREIWMMAKRRGLFVELFSNASLITAEWADFFADWTPKQISMTLYGATEETYRRMTGRTDMYGRVKKALDLLVERGVPVEVKTLFARPNSHEFTSLREQMSEYDDVFRWQAELCGTYSEGGGDPDAVRLSPKEIIQLELADPVRSKEWARRLAEWKPAKHLKDTAFRCALGAGRFHIDPYGRMRPCMMLESFSYDVRSGSVHEGWRKVIPELLTDYTCDPGPCQTCAMAEVCRVCPAYAMLSDCPPGGPSPFHCGLARERAAAFGIEARVAAET